MNSKTKLTVITHSRRTRIKSRAGVIDGIKAHFYMVQISRAGLWITVKSYTALDPYGDPEADAYAYRCACELRHHIRQNEEV